MEMMVGRRGWSESGHVRGSDRAWVAIQGWACVSNGGVGGGGNRCVLSS